MEQDAYSRVPSEQATLSSHSDTSSVGSNRRQDASDSSDDSSREDFLERSDPVRLSALDLKNLADLVLKLFLESRLVGNPTGKEADTGKGKGVEVDDGSASNPAISDINKPFACPYYRDNPEGRWTCLQQANELRTIKGLIEHLDEYHVWEMVCPSCHATFTTSPETDDHIRSRSCKVLDYPMAKALTDIQVRDLRYLFLMIFPDEVKISVTPAIQWSIIWDQAFRGRVPPYEEVYLTTDFETLVVAVQDFWLHNDHRIVPDFLQSRESPKDSGESKECDMHELHDAVRGELADQLVACYTAQGEQGKAQEHPHAARVLSTLLDRPASE